MSIAWGTLLGVGLLLLLSPWLWPARSREVPRVWQRRITGPVELLLSGAGMPSVRPLLFLSGCVLSGFGAAALVQALLGVSALSMCVGLACTLLPIQFVRRRLIARRAAHLSAWPDVVDHLISGVRSGLALPDSISMLAHTGPPAARAAFAGFERDYHASGNFSASLDHLKAQLADPVADRILETLRMARHVGGTDLAVVLRDLASYLREDAAIRAEVQARQSWTRNAARLGIIAPWIVLLLLISRPEAAAAYIIHRSALPSSLPAPS